MSVALDIFGGYGKKSDERYDEYITDRLLLKQDRIGILTSPRKSEGAVQL